MSNVRNFIKRGYVIMVDLGDQVGSVQSLIRLAIVVQNNKGNLNSTTTIVVPLTSRNRKSLPTHHILEKYDYDFLHTDSIALCEQITTISEQQIKKIIGKIDGEVMSEIDRKLAISINLRLAL